MRVLGKGQNRLGIYIEGLVDSKTGSITQTVRTQACQDPRQVRGEVENVIRWSGHSA